RADDDATQHDTTQHSASQASNGAGKGEMRIALTGLKSQEIPQMLEELGNLGTVKDPHQTDTSVEVTLVTSESEDDISAVLCFVLEPEQISFKSAVASQPAVAEVVEALAAVETPVVPVAPPAPVAAKPQSAPENGKNKAKTGDTSIRVAVEKVDQLINLVGELVITQSMLAQRSS
ncbi:chemotaxis protein CheA, partial [Dickeya dadantii]|nr:chemotaxis protein CheA [Dickeya dadantii]